MRYIGKHKNAPLRQKQVEILCDIMSKLKNADEIEQFLDVLLSRSELAYISQRIHIIQLLLQEQSYQEIKYEVGTTDGTISISKQHLNNFDQNFWELILSGKPKKKKVLPAKNDTDRRWVEPHYPGAIKI